MDYLADTKTKKKKKKVSVLWVLFVIVYIIAKVAAYYKAWSCTGDQYTKTGPARKIANMVLAPLLGPLWWVFYWLESKNGYCQ